jgi:hypothetical protein
MALTDTQWMQLLQDSNLQPAEDGWFFGRLQKSPIALKIMQSEGSEVLLLQVRLRKKTDPEFALALGDSKLAHLIASKEADISFDSSVAWLTLNNPEDDPRPVVDEFLAALATAGLSSTQACHYCGANEVQKLTFDHGKVSQICEPCLEARLKKIPRAKPVDLVPLAIITIVAAFVGAIAWAAVWFGWDQLFLALKWDNVRLPRLVFVLIALAIGALAGGPAGWIIKRVPRRTRVTAGAAAILATLAALLCGEWLYTMLWVYRDYHVIAPMASLETLPKLWSGGVSLLKAFAAGMAFIVSFSMARPEKPRLEL